MSEPSKFELTLESERLLLRPLKPRDAQTLFDYRSDGIANQFQAWVPQNLAEVVDWIGDAKDRPFNQPNSWYQLAILIKSQDEMIGDVGLHFIGDQQVELGITLNKTQQGNGYATETLQRLIEYVFTELNKHRIVTSIDPANMSSLALMKRLHFRKEAHFIKSLHFKGEWVDDIVYAMLRDEWLEMKS